MKKALLLAAIGLLLASCGTLQTNYYAGYDIVLSEVESPENAKVEYGETKVVTIEEEGVSKYVYEDDYMRIAWHVDLKMFHFVLTNKTKHSIKIDWDDISYVDINGAARRVIHSGIKYNEMSNDQAPTTIPRRASITDLILPTDNVKYYDYVGWLTHFLFPMHYTSQIDLNTIAPTYVGREMSILMPIEIEGVRNEYMFIFNVDKFLGNQ